jgi:DNA-binding response OmpR family regulator
MIEQANTTSRKPFSVLVVDDDDYILAFIGIRLKLQGYNVLTASDGTRALEIVRSELPDVAVVDLLMPGMDGVALMEEIRKLSPIPILILTAIDWYDRIVDELLKYAEVVLHKPFHVDELVARIETIRKRQPNPVSGTEW